MRKLQRTEEPMKTAADNFVSQAVHAGRRAGSGREADGIATSFTPSRKWYNGGVTGEDGSLEVVGCSALSNGGKVSSNVLSVRYGGGSSGLAGCF
jgi:hypothetical protein